MKFLYEFSCFHKPFFSMIIKWAAAAAAAKSLLTLQHTCAAGGHRVFRLYSAAVWAYIISVKPDEY
jgi:hypothetical protein